MFYDNFSYLCKKKGISEKKAGIEMGLSNSVTQKWKKGSVPHGETLSIIAKYFGVSVGYLLGEGEKGKATTFSGDGLSDKDRALLNWFRSLPKEKQQAILTAQDAPKEIL